MVQCIGMFFEVGRAGGFLGRLVDWSVCLDWLGWRVGRLVRWDFSFKKCKFEIFF